MVGSHTAPAPTAVLPLLQALADENRLRIMEVLQDGERCVCDLQSSLDLGQSLLSHHLRVLREAGLVRSRREGRWIHYALADAALSAAEAWISGIRKNANMSESHGSTC